ncbi:TIGR01458 family HAD-type hydrolase [Cellvibrio sp. PSBB023]|uniref:TIGR01458 family HAD-type hydrolase n=1 Tax=Cellvibrio sp. PSBB023 TaxID=1945512 RepID=UPI00098F4036|nr:TIGR01458 family HAD-type hydrolase [Cellvibrio sp. PSBB023]AQT58779.1 HAD family hydrolase [Cellvibrio sp. PSBB023]
MNIRPRLVLFDLDGTLYVGDTPIPGAIDCLAALRAQGIALRFLTNTTTKSQQQLVGQLRAMGFTLGDNELISAPVAARLALEKMQQQAGRPLRIWPLVADAIQPDFSNFVIDEQQPDYVVLGDIGDRWDLALINRLFQVMHSGAELIALHKGRFWQTGDGLKADIGFFVAGLEYVCSKNALVMGKPNRDFFQLILDSAGVAASDALMVGDDIDSDVGGAQQMGIVGCLVKTGKFRASYFAQSSVCPDMVLDSVADLTVR